MKPLIITKEIDRAMLTPKIANTIKPFLLSVAIASALGLTSTTAHAAGAPALPPALQAAVQSGNARAISQAISTLSGGDPQKSANLADAVVAAAEKMLSTNPQAAVLAAKAAVETVKALPVQASAPTQTQDVLTTAARIFINPEAQRVAPTQTAELAAATVQAAATTNNSSVIGSIANQAATTAEKLLPTNPAAAMQIASAAIQAIKSDAVLNSNPQSALQAATTVGRIITNPEAQKNNPQGAGDLSKDLATIGSNPSVQAASPAGALSMLANAYAAASSPTVNSANPGLQQQVHDSLSQSAKDMALNATDHDWNKDVTAIINPKNADDGSRKNREEGQQAQQSQQNQQQLQQLQQQQNQQTQPATSERQVQPTASPS